MSVAPSRCVQLNPESADTHNSAQVSGIGEVLATADATSVVPSAENLICFQNRSSARSAHVNPLSVEIQMYPFADDAATFSPFADIATPCQFMS
jgi:hypothetical protein